MRNGVLVLLICFFSQLNHDKVKSSWYTATSVGKDAQYTKTRKGFNALLSKIQRGSILFISNSMGFFFSWKCLHLMLDLSSSVFWKKVLYPCPFKSPNSNYFWLASFHLASWKVFCQKIVKGTYEIRCYFYCYRETMGSVWTTYTIVMHITSFIITVFTWIHLKHICLFETMARPLP